MLPQYLMVTHLLPWVVVQYYSAWKWLVHIWNILFLQMSEWLVWFWHCLAGWAELISAPGPDLAPLHRRRWVRHRRDVCVCSINSSALEEHNAKGAFQLHSCHMESPGLVWTLGLSSRMWVQFSAGFITLLPVSDKVVAAEKLMKNRYNGVNYKPMKRANRCCFEVTDLIKTFCACQRKHAWMQSTFILSFNNL